MRKIIVEEDLHKVLSLLEKVSGVDRYQAIERMGGLTNRTYHVTLEDSSEYVVRIPGEGTEEIIERKHEKISTELACQLGVDAKLIYFDDDGSKVTQYIPNAVTLSAKGLSEPSNIEKVADIFQKIHTCGVDTGVPFEVFDMAKNYEKIIVDADVAMFADYPEFKQKVMEIKAAVDAAVDIRKVPCHNDALCENWVSSDDRLYLIDWEYAGMNDGMWDLADVSIEAGFQEEQDILLLTHYLGGKPTNIQILHFLANKIYVDYLWALWAMARVPYDGISMENWAVERYTRMKATIQQYYALSHSAE